MGTESVSRWMCISLSALRLLCLAAVLPASTARGLEGTAAWDIELVREYIKVMQGVEMPAEPAAFPRQEKLAEVNAEFAARMKALLAVYQAHGGVPIGIMPDGGLRSREDQRRIYAECRHIRWSVSQTGSRGEVGSQEELDETLSNTVPAGDGSSKEHWEIDWVPAVDDKGNFTWQPNCGRPPTDAWVSWHNLGLAVDLAYTNNDAFGRMVSAAQDLGMSWGGWFGGRAPGQAAFDVLPDKNLSPYMRHAAEVLGWDLGHFEWHPGQYEPETFDAQSGTALDSSYLRLGYNWKLPDTIYRIQRGPSRSTLWVYDLVHEGNWIKLSKMRIIQGDAQDWEGDWYSFEPAIRLFPVYIPTVRFDGTMKAESVRLGSTQVTEQSYSHRGGHPQHFEWAGRWNYTVGFRMTNWPIVAGIEIQRHDHLRREEARRIGRQVSAVPRYPGYDGFRQIRDASVYDVAIDLETRRMMHQVRSRTVDTQGYTTDGQSAAGVKSELSVPLDLAWNRDEGEVGIVWGSLPQSGSALVEQHPSGDSGISASLPAGAFDVATPPPWTPPNPKPPPRPSNFNWRP